MHNTILAPALVDGPPSQAVSVCRCKDGVCLARRLLMEISKCELFLHAQLLHGFAVASAQNPKLPASGWQCSAEQIHTAL